MPGGGVYYRGRFSLLYVSFESIGILSGLKGDGEIDPIECAALCEKGGCDGITIRLHQDTIAIKDEDVLAIKGRISGKLNLEMALSEENIGIARKANPDKIIVFPERSGESAGMTGLDLKTAFPKIKDTVQRFHDQNIQASLCIEPDIETVELSKEIGADFIEIHTGAYARAAHDEDIDREITRIYSAANHAVKVGLKVSAGHGLTYNNITPVLKARALEELNIGHSIISRAVLVGLPKAIEEMMDILE